MKLLTDENVDPLVVGGLRAAKYQVIDVKSSGWQGASDARLVNLAIKHRAVIITHDNDFLHEGRVGVVILRLRRPSPSVVLDRVVDVLAQMPFRTLLKKRGTIVITDRGIQTHPASVRRS